MANLNQLAILREGCRAWNRWRTENPTVVVDLRHAVLVGADLREANLAGADLTGAHLAGAFLDRAILTHATLLGAKAFRAHLGGADLKAANLQDADLGGAHLCDADLTGANLRGTHLRGTNFYGALLAGANLSDAEFGRTIIANVDLRAVAGLVQVHHVESSSIGMDTYFKSDGQIPRDFLIAAGVTGEFCSCLANFTANRTTESLRPPCL